MAFMPDKTEQISRNPRGLLARKTDYKCNIPWPACHINRYDKITMYRIPSSTIEPLGKMFYTAKRYTYIYFTSVKDVIFSSMIKCTIPEQLQK